MHHDVNETSELPVSTSGLVTVDNTDSTAALLSTGIHLATSLPIFSIFTTASKFRSCTALYASHAQSRRDSFKFLFA